MACLTRGVFIVGAKRTPFGAFGGRLKDVDAIELGRVASVAALEQANVTPDLVDSVICGNIGQVNAKNGPYIARHMGLKTGINCLCLKVEQRQLIKSSLVGLAGLFLAVFAISTHFQ